MRSWLRTTVVGLAVLLTAALPVVRVGWGVRGGPVLTVLTFLALGVLRLDLLPVLLVLVGVGLLIHRPRPEERSA